MGSNDSFISVKILAQRRMVCGSRIAIEIFVLWVKDSLRSGVGFETRIN